MQRPHVIRFSGELDIWRAGEIEEQLRDVDAEAVVVDLTAVRYVDSAFLNALVRFHRRCPQTHVTVLVGTTSVRRIFTITELDRIFAVEVAEGETPDPHVRGQS